MSVSKEAVVGVSGYGFDWGCQEGMRLGGAIMERRFIILEDVVDRIRR
jgi:hypothetical protein